MDLAGKASQIAMNRTIGVWTDEGTGDLGNEGIPQPYKPENVKSINARLVSEVYSVVL